MTTISFPRRQQRGDDSTIAERGQLRVKLRRIPWSYLFNRAALLLLIILIPWLVQADWLTEEQIFSRDIELLFAPHRLGIVGWSAGAILEKSQSVLYDPTRGMEIQRQTDTVREYSFNARRLGALLNQLERIYADPGITQSEQIAAPIEWEIALLRKVQGVDRPLVESILERQVTEALRDKGIHHGGIVFPPVLFRFQEPLTMLILSPRAEIRRTYALTLADDLSAAERDRLEQEIERRYPDLSAYITNIGGLGAWPTMVVDRASITWFLSTIGHEWGHTWLTVRPLGFNYFRSSDTIIMNETVCDIIGEEVARAVIARHYPDLPPPRRPDFSPPPPPEKIDEDEFDFRRAMRETRLRVDELLAEGKTEEAERYMEERRQLFVAEGYALRRLNQAYFAFHGSYAASPAAVDPIGPKLYELRDRSPSLRDFLHKVAQITTVEELDTLLEEAERAARSPEGS